MNLALKFKLWCKIEKVPKVAKITLRLGCDCSEKTEVDFCCPCAPTDLRAASVKIVLHCGGLFESLSPF